MAASTILSFNDLDGNAVKIASVYISKVTDVTTHRILETSVPTRQYKTELSLSSIQTESGALYAATENGNNILLNSLLVKNLVSNGSGCDILEQGGSRVSVSESISVIESRIDALNPEDVNTPISDPSPPTTLDSSDYYSLTTSGTYTIEDAANIFSQTNAFQMQIKNASGGNITIQRSSTNTFYGLSGSVTSFILADGEFVTLTAATTSRYDIN